MHLPRKNIRSKLVRGSVINLSIAFFVVVLVVSLVSIRSSNKNLAQTQKQIHGALIAKGMTLIVNNSIAMRGMAEDNAVLGIRDLVSATVEKDDDLVYGIFMDADHQPWAMTFKGQGPMPESQKPLNDSMSLWAAALQQAEFHTVHYNNEEVIEFASPVAAKNQRMGTIRYALTTRSMHSLIHDARTSASRQLAEVLALLGCIAAGTLAFAGFAARRQANNLSRPINSLVASASQISAGDYSIEIKPETDDEIGVLSSTFELMRKTIKKYTEHLQELVDEKMQQVRDIMGNIDQALFTVNDDLSVNPEYSTRSNSIFGVEDLCRHKLPELFRTGFEGTTYLREWFNLVKKKHKSQRWDKLKKLAPVQELELTGPGSGTPRYIRLDFQKILDKQDNLARIMVLGQDVTRNREIEKLVESERARHETEVKVVLGIVNQSPEVIGEFVCDCENRMYDNTSKLTEMLACVRRPREKYPNGPEFEITRDDIFLLFRNLHTIKGNAGSYGFDALSAAAHECESALECLMPPVTSRRSDTIERLLGLLALVDERLAEIKAMIGRLTGGEKETAISIPRSRVDRIKDLCRSMLKQDNVQGSDAKRLLDLCRRIDYKTLGILTMKYRDLIHRAAERLSKEVRFCVVNPHLEVHPRSFDVVDEAILHILRNAIVHGIEAPDVRDRSGKSAGTIEMEFKESGNGRIIRITDNGKGIDAEAVVQKAVAMGIVDERRADGLTREEKVGLIFHPGLSTGTTVSSISGRGVGMAIAKKVVESLGGTISIETEQGKGTTFILSVPVVGEDSAVGGEGRTDDLGEDQSGPGRNFHYPYPGDVTCKP